MEKLFFWGKLNFFPSLVVFFRRRNLRNLKFEIFSAPIHHSSVWCRREREKSWRRTENFLLVELITFFFFFVFFCLNEPPYSLFESRICIWNELSKILSGYSRRRGGNGTTRAEEEQGIFVNFLPFHFDGVQTLLSLFFFFSSLIFKKSEKFRLIDGWHESSINYERSSTRCWADFLVKNP